MAFFDPFSFDIYCGFLTGAFFGVAFRTGGFAAVAGFFAALVAELPGGAGLTSDSSPVMRV